MKLSALKLPRRKLPAMKSYDDYAPEPEEPQSRVLRYADYVPIGAIIIGFGLMALGWNGAAGFDCTACQIPYLISGGLMGLGIVIFGASALVVQTMKKGNARQEAELESLNRNLERVASALSFSTNGQKSETGDLVVVGASSFHLPSCRTVAGRSDLVRVPREEAVGEGLEACRICNP